MGCRDRRFEPRVGSQFQRRTEPVPKQMSRRCRSEVGAPLRTSHLASSSATYTIRTYRGCRTAMTTMVTTVKNATTIFTALWVVFT